ncbi:hypothetical protein C8Q78DRAFT_997282 [Trametes maxima]|nr:hypothetical protein C8Q78DRAFT_997282 [Trametes maxima]
MVSTGRQTERPSKQSATDQKGQAELTGAASRLSVYPRARCFSPRVSFLARFVVADRPCSPNMVSETKGSDVIDKPVPGRPHIILHTLPSLSFSTPTQSFNVQFSIRSPLDEKMATPHHAEGAYLCRQHAKVGTYDRDVLPPKSL